MEEFTKFIDTFIMSGGIGFISYFILSRKGSLNIRKEDKEDKALFIIFFSVVNMGIYLFSMFCIPQLLSYVYKYDQLKLLNNTYLFRALAIGLTVVVSIYLSLNLYQKLWESLEKKINKARIKERKASIYSHSPRVDALDKDYIIEVFAFTLNRINGQRDYISNGFIDSWSDIIDDRKQIILYTRQNNYKTRVFKEEEVLEIINSENVPENMARIYIDKDLDMILYLLYIEKK